ncbi:MAG: fibronectin type III domain-containing protein [Paludibacteraceae bacterium]|nr:fibronectin type III domain-containing protein [Paludibacteraceae bacterium]
MKKFFTLFVAFVALSVYAGDLKIGVNDASQKNAPVYGPDADRYQYHNQTIYSASELTALVGQKITKITFYQKSTYNKPAKDFENVQISIMEVSGTTFASTDFMATSGATVVYTGSLAASTTTDLEAVLTTEYEYGGGNLLIDVQKTQPSGGGYAGSSWKGFQASSVTGATLYGRGSASGLPTEGTISNYRFDVLFTYEEAAAPACAKITSLTASNITANSATLTWASEAENYQFVCVLKGLEPAWDGVAAKAVKTVALDTLKSNTEYDFYVRSFCSETEQGTAKKISFKTELSCFAPTMPTVAEETITAESAVVSWHASGKGETQYQVTYGAYGSEPDWSKATLTSELSATLTGLNAASAYQVWIRSYCSADDQSDAVTEYFTTKCGTVKLPFNDDFSAGIDCWTTKDLAGYSEVSALGQFKFAWAATPPYQTIITPEFIASAKQVSVTFQYKAHQSTYTESFKVGYSTTTNSLESFTWSDLVETNSTSFETYFDVLPAGVKYVAIQCWSNNQYYLYIDDFSVAEYEAPKCPAPKDLKVSNIAAKTATLAWTSEASAWKYQLSADGENWGEAQAAATNPFELSGLKANTLYYARVQADCGENGVSEWTDAVSFRTECGALSLPYAEGFEGAEANALPSCWARVSTDEFPAVFVDNFYYTKAYEGSKSLKFYGYEINQIAVLPELEGALSKVTLSFYYTATDDAEAPVAYIGYITNLADATSFVSVKTLAAASEYTQAQVNFESAPAGARIAIRYQGGTYFGSLFVDNVEIKEASATAIERTTVNNKAVKRVIDGQVVIIKNGVLYNILGSEIK